MRSHLPRLFRLAVLIVLIGIHQGYADGVTILIHGWQLGTSEPWWTGSMQEAIDDEWLEDEERFGKITVTGTLGNLTATCSPWNVDMSSSSTGEIIVRVDWHSVADHLVSFVPAQDVAAVIAPKIYQGQGGENPLAELPIHIIGHSRGGGMVCELARILGEQGIEVEQVTPLDPHPLTMADPQPWTPVIDTPVTVYENVLFMDNYWQDIDWPEGEYISGAYNRLWTSMPGGYHDHPSPAWDDVADHLNIHLMYFGTIDLNTPAFDGEDTCGAYERINWFNDYETVGGIGGSRAGFYYSRIAGEADRLSTDTPVSGGDQIIDGYHNDALLGGSGARSSLSWTSAVWPNVVTLDVEKDGSALPPTDCYVIAGDILNVSYIYRDYASGGTVTLTFDTDRNPYNSNDIAAIATSGYAATGTSLTQGSDSWDTSPLSAGDSGYVRVEINNGSHRRYIYGSPKIHILEQSFEIDLSSSVQIDTLVLDWDTVPPATSYWVYGASNDAYFDPQVESPFAFRQAVTTETTWSSDSGIGDPDTNWTYLVIAVDGADNEIGRSNRIGEHDFLLP